MGSALDNFAVSWSWAYMGVDGSECNLVQSLPKSRGIGSSDTRLGYPSGDWGRTVFTPAARWSQVWSGHTPVPQPSLWGCRVTACWPLCTLLVAKPSRICPWWLTLWLQLWAAFPVVATSWLSATETECHFDSWGWSSSCRPTCGTLPQHYWGRVYSIPRPPPWACHSWLLPPVGGFSRLTWPPLWGRGQWSGPCPPQVCNASVVTSAIVATQSRGAGCLGRDHLEEWRWPCSAYRGLALP